MEIGWLTRESTSLFIFKKNIQKADEQIIKQVLVGEIKGKKHLGRPKTR